MKKAYKYKGIKYLLAGKETTLTEVAKALEYEPEQKKFINRLVDSLFEAGYFTEGVIASIDWTPLVEADDGPMYIASKSEELFASGLYIAQDGRDGCRLYFAE